MGRFQLELIYLYFPPCDGKTVENKGKLILTKKNSIKRNPKVTIMEYIFDSEGWRKKTNLP